MLCGLARANGLQLAARFDAVRFDAAIAMENIPRVPDLFVELAAEADLAEAFGVGAASGGGKQLRIALENSDRLDDGLGRLLVERDARGPLAIGPSHDLGGAPFA